MKKLILILFAFSLIMGATAQEFWETVDNQFYTRSFDMDQNGTIYIGANDTLNNTKGVFKSENDGQSWEQMYENNAFDPGVVYCKNDMVYFSDGGQLKRSTNQGQSWNTLYTGIANIKSVLHGISGNIYLGSDALCRSIDNGQTWDTLLSPAPSVESFEDIFQISDDTLLAASINWVGEGGIYRTTDGGDTWDWVVQNCMVTSLVETTDGVIISGGFGCYYGSGGHVMRSYDQGETWESVYSLTGLQIKSMTITPEDVLYFGTTGEDGYTIHRSFDYGETWEEIESDLIEPTATVHRIKALGDGHIYVSATIPFTNDCLLYRSYDPLYTSLPECELTGLNLTARPNPATEQVTFERSMTDKEGLLRFYNVNGTTIRKARFSKGQKQLKVNVSSWPSGMYLARIINQGRNLESVKFVVR